MYMADVGKREFNCSRQIIYSTMGGHGGGVEVRPHATSSGWGNPFPPPHNGRYVFL